MSNTLDILLGCGHCGEDTPPYDVADRTWQQWQCPHCKDWNNWMKTTTQDDDRMSNMGRFSDEISKLFEDEGPAVTIVGNSPFVAPRPLDHIMNRLKPAVSPGIGKSKLMKKLFKKTKKKDRRKWAKWGTSYIAKTKPAAYGSNPNTLAKRAGDHTGFITPTESGIAELGRIVTEHDLGEYRMPPWFKPDHWPAASGRIQSARAARWDLKDEDGDVHSPSWYLDAWVTSRATYLENLHKHYDDPAEDELHMKLLDDMLVELEIYGTYVNKLFGSDMVEGVWNKEEGDE